MGRWFFSRGSYHSGIHMARADAEMTDEEKKHIIKVLREDLDNNISSVEARRDASPVMDKIEFLKKIGTPDDLIERTKEWQMKNGLDPEGLYNKMKEERDERG